MSGPVRSSRLPGDLEPNRIARVLAAKRAAGEPVLDLTESNPTRAGFEYPAGLLAALSLPENLRYDPEPRGFVVAREAVAAYYAAHGARVDPRHIVLTASTSEAYGFLFKLL